MTNNIESGIAINVENGEDGTIIKGEFTMSVILSTKVGDDTDIELVKDYMRIRLKDETIKVLAKNVYEESSKDRILGCMVYDSNGIESGDMLMIINPRDHACLIKNKIQEMLNEER